MQLEKSATVSPGLVSVGRIAEVRDGNKSALLNEVNAVPKAHCIKVTVGMSAVA